MNVLSFNLAPQLSKWQKGDEAGGQNKGETAEEGENKGTSVQGAMEENRSSSEQTGILLISFCMLIISMKMRRKSKTLPNLWLHMRKMLGSVRGSWCDVILSVVFNSPPS